MKPFVLAFDLRGPTVAELNRVVGIQPCVEPVFAYRMGNELLIESDRFPVIPPSDTDIVVHGEDVTHARVT